MHALVISGAFYGMSAYKDWSYPAAAKAFRRKLLRRPIALRGNTEHFQPNMLGKVVLRYLEGMDEPLINGVKAIIRETMGGTCLASAEGIATLRTLCQEVGCPFHDELCITTCCTALAVLWMALHKEKFLCLQPHCKQLLVS